MQIFDLQSHLHVNKHQASNADIRLQQKITWHEALFLLDTVTCLTKTQASASVQPRKTYTPSLSIHIMWTYYYTLLLWYVITCILDESVKWSLFIYWSWTQSVFLSLSVSFFVGGPAGELQHQGSCSSEFWEGQQWGRCLPGPPLQPAGEWKTVQTTNELNVTHKVEYWITVCTSLQSQDESIRDRNTFPNRKQTFDSISFPSPPVFQAYHSASLRKASLSNRTSPLTVRPASSSHVPRDDSDLTAHLRAHVCVLTAAHAGGKKKRPRSSARGLSTVHSLTHTPTCTAKHMHGHRHSMQAHMRCLLAFEWAKNR